MAMSRGGGSRSSGPSQHLNAVSAALDGLQLALAWRYTVAMCAALGGQTSAAVPGPAHAEGGGAIHVELKEADKAHASLCSFIAWCRESEPGTLPNGVACDGRVPQGLCTDGSDQGFRCRAPELITTAIGWAEQDRDWIQERIPKFASQQIAALQAARDAFANAAQVFGATPEGDSDDWDTEGAISVELDDLSSTLPQTVDSIDYLEYDASDPWMVGWTGAAAEQAAAGFFHTVGPTLNNHAIISNALGYLINLRATIIDENRRNTLDLIGSATEALGATATTEIDLTKRWAVVEGVGMAISLTGAGAVIGAPITFVGWLGSKLKPTKKDLDFKSEPQEVAGGLAAAFDEMKRDIEYSEAGYRAESQALENAIGSAKLETLELYDITQNNPEGTAGKGGEFSADIDEMTNLAKVCYGVADAYQELRSQLGHVYAGDSHMTDQDGDPTDADKRVLTMREDLLDFISTTIGRYCLVGDQIEEAARSYAEADEGAAANFESYEASMETAGQGPPMSSTEAAELAEATDRDSEPGPQPETAEDGPEVDYDPEGWENPRPEPQQGAA
jgi:hypothetical protein